MDNAEPIGNESVTQLGDLLGVGIALRLVLAGLFGVEADVLQKDNVTILHGVNLGFGIGTIGVVGQGDGDTQELTQAVGDRRQAEFGNDLTLRAAQVGHQDDLGALAAEFLDGGQSGLDAAVVLDGCAVKRHIEVCTHQDALALEITEALQCFHAIPFLAADMTKPPVCATSGYETRVVVHGTKASRRLEQ